MSKKILIIDDNKDILKILTMFFRGKDYDVTVSNTALGQEEIKSINPDLLLLDVNLKGSDVMGDEICKQLKSKDDTQGLPVLLLSGQENLPAIAVECHANDFIRKPFNISLLKSKIYDTLSFR